MKKIQKTQVIKFALLSTIFSYGIDANAIQCFDKMNAFSRQSSALVSAGKKGLFLKKFSVELKEISQKLGKDISESDVLEAKDLETSTPFYVIVDGKNLIFLTQKPESLGVTTNWGLIQNGTIGFNKVDFAPKRVLLGKDKIAINQGNRWRILRKEAVDGKQFLSWVKEGTQEVGAEHKQWKKELASLLETPLKNTPYSYNILTVNDLKQAEFFKSEDGETTFAVINNALYFLRKNAVLDDMTQGLKVGLVPTSGPGFSHLNKNTIKLKDGLALVISDFEFKVLPQYEIPSMLDLKSIDYSSIKGVEEDIVSFVKENEDILPAKMEELELSFTELFSSKVMTIQDGESGRKLWLNDAGVFLVQDGKFSRVNIDSLGVYRGENFQARISDTEVLIFEKGKSVISKNYAVGDDAYLSEIEKSDMDALRSFVNFHGITKEEFEKSVRLYSGSTFDISGEVTLAEYNRTLYILDEGEFKKYFPNIGIGFHANVEKEFNIGNNFVIRFDSKGMVKYPILKEGMENDFAAAFLQGQNSAFNQAMMSDLGVGVVASLLKQGVLDSKTLFASKLALAFDKNGQSYPVLKTADEVYVVVSSSDGTKVGLMAMSTSNMELYLDGYTKIKGVQAMGITAARKVQEETLLANEFNGVFGLKAEYLLGRALTEKEFGLLQYAFQLHYVIYGGVVYNKQRTQETVNEAIRILSSSESFTKEEMQKIISSGLI